MCSCIITNKIINHISSFNYSTVVKRSSLIFTMSDKYITDVSKSGSGSGGGRERDRSRSRSPQKRDGEKKPENVALGAKNRLKSLGIQMKLNAQKQITKPKITVASAFNQDDDDDVREMPPEAKMRMRNIGRDTPTSSGPNSFGKTKHGFSDAKKVFEKNLKEAMESALADD